MMDLEFSFEKAPWEDRLGALRPGDTVLAVELLGLPDLVTLMVQVAAGVVLYVAISAGFRLEPFVMLLEMIRKK